MFSRKGSFGGAKQPDTSSVWQRQRGTSAGADRGGKAAGRSRRPSTSGLGALLRRKTPSTSRMASSAQLHMYTQEELDEYKQVFAMFDADGRGSIGIDEMASAMGKLGVSSSKDELAGIMNEVDEDGNEQIDFTEFCKVMRRLSPPRGTAAASGGGDAPNEWAAIVAESYAVFNRTENERGVIRSDFRCILFHYGKIASESVMDEIFDEFDVDNDGVLNYHELSALMAHYLTDDDIQTSRCVRHTSTSDSDMPSDYC